MTPQTFSVSETTETTPTPTAPATETLEQLRSEASGGIADDNRAGNEERPTKRRGRPPGSKTRPKEPEPEAFQSSVLEPLIALPFDIVAKRRGEHWKLSPEEKTALSSALAAVANKYGERLGPYAAEITLVVVAVAIVTPRITTDLAAKIEPDESTPQ